MSVGSNTILTLTFVSAYLSPFTTSVTKQQQLVTGLTQISHCEQHDQQVTVHSFFSREASGDRRAVSRQTVLAKKYWAHCTFSHCTLYWRQGSCLVATPQQWFDRVGTSLEQLLGCIGIQKTCKHMVSVQGPDGRVMSMSQKQYTTLDHWALLAINRFPCIL